MGRLARLALAAPARTLLVLLVVTAGLGAGLARLRTEVGYRAFLGAHHPAVARFDRFVERFEGGLPLAAVWSCRGSKACESVFDPAALRMADSVARQLAASPAVRRVRSPSSAPVVIATPFGVFRRRLLEGGEPAPDLGGLRRAALRDPDWVGGLVSPDGSAGAIVAELTSSSGAAAERAFADLQAALAPFERQGFEFARVGGPVEFVVAGGELARATRKMVPLMVALVGAVLLVLLRSLPAAAAALVTVGAAVLWTQGLQGWLGFAQNSISQALAPLLLVVGVCDGIHVISLYAQGAARGARAPQGPEERRELLVRIADDVGGACAMTSLTTAAGFASFATSGLQSFLHFGLAAAFGVLAALLLSFTLLPILLVAVAPARVPVRRASARWDRLLGRLMDLNRRHAGAILAVTALVALLAALGASRVRVDATFEELYGRGSPVVRWAHFSAEHLARPDRLEIDLAAPRPEAVLQPEALALASAIAVAADREAVLDRPRSVLDLLSAVRRSEGDPVAPEAVPALPATEVSRLLAEVREADPGVPARWVDLEAGHLRVRLDADKTPQAQMRRVIARLRQTVADRLPPGWTAELTGPFALIHDMVDAIRSTQLRSFGSAALLVLGLVAVFLRSPRWALLAGIPTVLPVGVTLAMLAAIGRPLDVGSSMVAAIVLGIAVDDAIHMLDRVRRLRADGRGPAQAVHDAVGHVGRALVTTSLALAVGFSALALSPWESIAHFGLLSAVSILGALVADLVVLPALLLRLGGSGTKPEPR